jgi:hypothetical protein
MCENEDGNVVRKDKMVIERWWQYVLELLNSYSELQMRVEIVCYGAETYMKLLRLARI